MKKRQTPVYAMLVISGWHGATATRVVLLGSTPRRFRIRAITRTRLAGRGRFLEPGQEALVPLTAVQVTGEGVAPLEHAAQGKGTTP